MGVKGAKTTRSTATTNIPMPVITLVFIFLPFNYDKSVSKKQKG
jgi:hypothetical protein